MKLPSLLPLLLSTHPTTANITLNQRVCMTGFIMDTFCIERGTLLDNPSVTTMANPELHSYHCLLDVGVCVNSGFNILGSKDDNNDGGLYCPGLRIDTMDTNTVLAAGRAHGTSIRDHPNFAPCDTCTGPDDAPIAGYRATIIGTVSELGDGLGVSTGVPGGRSVDDSPVLRDVQVLDSSVDGCPSDVVEVSVEAAALGGECLIRSVGGGDGASLFVVEEDVANVPVTTTVAAAPTTTTAIATTITSTAVKDCSNDFCEKAVAEGYLLRYKINEEEATVSMEVIYDGDAWVGIAFSQDERMGGSDGVM